MEYKTLNNGVIMPMLGFGVYQIKKEECEQKVIEAIQSGYRLIDTAAIYMNEIEVGKAIQNCGVNREDLFITTKLWVQDAGYEKSQKAIDAALQRLQLDYIDLLLIHEPMGDIYGQWKAMEEAYHAGKVRALGVSNMYAARLMDFLMHVNVKPVINQIRTNPYFQHQDTKQFMDQYDIVHEAHSPFSQGNHQLFENEILLKIASKHHKSVGQIILRWLIQRGIVTLTRTTHLFRMKENMDIFDFCLTDEDMHQISLLDDPQGNTFDNRNPNVVKRICLNRYHYDEEK